MSVRVLWERGRNSLRTIPNQAGGPESLSSACSSKCSRTATASIPGIGWGNLIGGSALVFSDEYEWPRSGNCVASEYDGACSTPLLEAATEPGVPRVGVGAMRSSFSESSRVKSNWGGPTQGESFAGTTRRSVALNVFLGVRSHTSIVRFEAHL